jgi:tubulin-specific chaperone A
VAENGPEGIAVAKKEKPDLIFLDLVLPGMSGYEILEKLRKDEETKNLKIYILSNLGQVGEIDKSFVDGADGYLVKANLTPTQLVENARKIFDGQNVGLKRKPVGSPVKNFKVKEVDKKAATQQTQGGGVSVLLIEDDAAIVDMYGLYLKKEGCRVEIAKNGAWGIKQAKEKKFDIIIMDMLMPAMNGYQALKDLKKDKKTKNTPVIVMSNSAQDKEMGKAKSCGAVCYLLKSQITPARLKKEIEKALKISNSPNF